jgi:uridine phosphorylase
MPIHVAAEPGDFAPVVLLPGDPNRATRIAARFDGGLDKARLVSERRGLLGYTGTVDGVPVSVQTTMMGTPTTSIVVEELLMLGVTTFIRVGTTGGFGRLGIGDALVALAAAPATGMGAVTHVGPIITSDVFYDPHPTGSVRWGRRGYMGVEMESAALFLIAMRERAKGRPVRAGTILTVSDVIVDPDDPNANRVDGEPWYRPPEDEVVRRVDLTIGAALKAAAALGRG